MTTRQADAAAAVAALRGQIDEFHAARQLTAEFLRGDRQARDPKTRQRIPQQELARRVATLRDRDTEVRAANELGAFRQLLAPEGAPNNALVPRLEDVGLGVFPVFALAAVVGGAATLYSVFAYLTERERRLQAELGIDTGSLTQKLARIATWAVPATLVVGAGVGSWYLLKRRKLLKKNPQGEAEAEAETETESEEGND